MQIDAIALPLHHPGSVNAWLLRGDPLTLVDTGPANRQALEALERGLAERGLALEDLELVLATHHHMDHVGLMAVIQRRSGAHVAVLDRVADYGARYHDRVAADRTFAHATMAAHGVPGSVVDGHEGFWRAITDNTEPFTADERLSNGDVVRAGGRDLRVVERPGHSATDALLVDEADGLALGGDHLLRDISSNTEIAPCGDGGERPRPRPRYLDNLRRTAGMPLRRILTGHGGEVTDPAGLVRARLEEHGERERRITELLAERPRTAYDVARDVWRASTVHSQALLVVWEVLGHLDVLAEAGAVAEEIDDDGLHVYSLTTRSNGHD